MTPDGDAGGRARTALVTGGTGGMGRVIAAKLAADGFDVAVAYAGNVDLADAAVGEIKGQGRDGAAFAADIADEEAVSDLFDAVEDRFGRLDAVVHTAAPGDHVALLVQAGRRPPAYARIWAFHRITGTTVLKVNAYIRP